MACVPFWRAHPYALIQGCSILLLPLWRVWCRWPKICFLECTSATILPTLRKKSWKQNVHLLYPSKSERVLNDQFCTIWLLRVAVLSCRIYTADLDDQFWFLDYIRFLDDQLISSFKSASYVTHLTKQPKVDTDTQKSLGWTGNIKGHWRVMWLRLVSWCSLSTNGISVMNDSHWQGNIKTNLLTWQLQMHVSDSYQVYFDIWIRPESNVRKSESSCLHLRRSYPIGAT